MADPLDLTNKILQHIQEDLSGLRGDVKSIRKDVGTMSKDIQELVSRAGRDNERLESRVRRIEEHLHLE
jgi:hypothetical protein